MPEVFTQKKLADLGITLDSVDPKGCQGCPAHDNGAFATRVLYALRGTHGRPEIDGPSVGAVCKYKRTENSRAELSELQVSCVKIIQTP